MIEKLLSFIYKLLLIILLITLLVFSASIIIKFNPQISSYIINSINKLQIKNNLLKSLIPQDKIINPKGVKEVTAEEVSNVGYTFLLAQIDNSDSPNLSDKTKNDITSIIHEAHFPKKQLLNIVFVIINTLAIESTTYIITPGGQIPVGSFPPEFLKGGGIYSGTYGRFNTSVIFINKNLISELRLKDVLTHELGHHIGRQMTDAEWKEYYELRYIPTGMERTSKEWRLSPQEDFAEVYSNIFTNYKIDTVFGLLESAQGFDMVAKCGVIHDELYFIEYYKQKAEKESIDINSIENNLKYKSDLQMDEDKELEEIVKSKMDEMDEYKELREILGKIIKPNSKLQDCRREILLNPEKYSDDYFLGVPYISKVSDGTKIFINEIIARLNN